MIETELRKAYVSRAEAYVGTRWGDVNHRHLIDVYNTIEPLPRGYAMQYDDDYCAAFVSSIAAQTDLLDIIPPEVGCGKMIEEYQRLGRWVEKDNYIPQTGDIIFFDWDDPGYVENTNSPDHVGIVAACDGTTITVVEGNNVEGGVGYRELPVDGWGVRGFGIPDYASRADAEPVEPDPVEPAETIDDIVKQVIAGEWGNGEDRKTRLKDAGYDYTEVQNRVNELLLDPGTYTKTVEQLAKEVIHGDWGNGSEREERITAAGYDYAAVQTKVNELLS